MNKEKCSACLSEIDFKAWDGEIASFEICPFCAIQFGYDDMAGGDIEKRKMIYKKWHDVWLINNRSQLSDEQKLEVIKSALES